MTDDQITTLLNPPSPRILRDVRLRPDLDMQQVAAPHARNGYHMKFDAALGLWAITGLGDTTYVAAADVISLQFSRDEREIALDSIPLDRSILPRRRPARA